MASHDIAVEVRGLNKAFRIPRRQFHTLKERALHPLRHVEHDTLHALHDVSFDIAQGEFFGIVGRNGSGKSTLLKCLAGIYRSDSGTIRVAGHLAPFIELGVGFNPNLTARDNVMINSVMMGLTPRVARERFDSIIAFAELEQFLDLELKNYSSGMQVRLAFAVMVQSDADVMLIDEVLAVGDAAFQQKCLDEFYRLRDEGKTIVLVTHEMAMIERFCHRAMLLENGEIRVIGSPEEAGRRYLELNFNPEHATPAEPVEEEPPAEEEEEKPAAPAGASLIAMRIEGGSGGTPAVAHGEPLRVHATIDMHETVTDAWLTLWVDNEDGMRLYGFSEPLQTVTAGERLHASLEAGNPVASGHYYVGWSVEHTLGYGNFAAFEPRAADVIVYAGDTVGGLVAVPHRMTVEREQGRERALSR